MKQNHEWEEKDLFVDPDIEVSDDGSEIIVYKKAVQGQSTLMRIQVIADTSAFFF